MGGGRRPTASLVADYPAGHGRPSLTGALAALMALSATSAYGSVLLAHIRSHFPDHLAGRGATTGNMAQLAGAAVLPMLTGLIPPLFPVTDSEYSLLAYQWIFATLALALAIGLAVYLTSRDARPDAGGPATRPRPTDARFVVPAQRSMLEACLRHDAWRE